MSSQIIFLIILKVHVKRALKILIFKLASSYKITLYNYKNLSSNKIKENINDKINLILIWMKLDSSNINIKIKTNLILHMFFNGEFGH